jgi:transcriptional regulator with XRE-family HTH domain
MVSQGGNDYAKHLGAELRNRRVARGLSLRATAKQLGLSAHGNLVDYEHGRRIPPEDLITGYERVFQVSDGMLRNLREKALAERADRQADLLLRTPARENPPDSASEPPPVPSQRRRPSRRWMMLGAAAVLIAAGITATVLLQPSPTSRTEVTSWSSCWGGKFLQLARSDSPSYNGTKALQITVTQPYMVGDVSVCTAHDLETLHPGMKVTAYLRAGFPQAGDGVRFFVYDSRFHDTWAPETPKSGRYMPLPEGTDWVRYEFTVPEVDVVHTLGMEIYVGTAQPATLWLGAVTW